MNRHYNSGGVQVEYLVVTLSLMAALWWGIFGDTGFWGDGNPRHNFSRTTQPSDAQTSSPSLIEALNEKQFDFARDVYQP